MLKVGIVGLPNVGKSSLFNSITKLEVESANYPFATIEPNFGVIELIDKRMHFLKDVFASKKVIYNQITFVDIAGIVKGASKGEGLGNKFLSNIREVDAIVHVVRGFHNKDIIHVNNNINPIDDIETINLELILSDLEQVNNWLTKNKKRIISSNKDLDKLNLIEKLKTQLENEDKLILEDLNEEELIFIKGFNFLSIKPSFYLINTSIEKSKEEEELIKNLSKYILDKKEDFIEISILFESEISNLDQEEQEIFLQEYNLEETGINKISKHIYKILGLGTYFTAGPQEIHAWTFKKGINAKKAAGIIHSDFERGFIKAEIYNYEDILEFKNERTLREKGKITLEGKDYIIKDGDVCLFKFNV